MTHRTASAPPVARPGGPIRIGISSGLLGEEARYDDGHERDSVLTGTSPRRPLALLDHHVLTRENPGELMLHDQV